MSEAVQFRTPKGKGPQTECSIVCLLSGVMRVHVILACRDCGWYRKSWWGAYEPPCGHLSENDPTPWPPDQCSLGYCPKPIIDRGTLTPGCLRQMNCSDLNQSDQVGFSWFPDRVVACYRDGWFSSNTCRLSMWKACSLTFAERKRQKGPFKENSRQSDSKVLSPVSLGSRSKPGLSLWKYGKHTWISFLLAWKRRLKVLGSLRGLNFFPLKILPVPSSKLVILALVFFFPCAWPVSGLLW